MAIISHYYLCVDRDSEEILAYLSIDEKSELQKKENAR